MNKVKLLKGRKPTKPRKPSKPKILSKTIKVPRLLANLPKNTKQSISSILDMIPIGVPIKDCYLESYSYTNYFKIFHNQEIPNKDFKEGSHSYKMALERYDKQVAAYDIKMIEYQTALQEYQDLQALQKLTGTLKPSQLKKMIENNT